MRLQSWVVGTSSRYEYQQIDIFSLCKVSRQSILDLLLAQVVGEHIKTCKVLELTTRQRAVWVAALHQVCLDNTLFLPTFPILDMSVSELEQAAIALHRWIELYGGFKKQHPGDFGDVLCPRTTRIITDVVIKRFPYIFLVPGGRYLVVAAREHLFIWDLGYVSSAHCTLIASVRLEGRYLVEPIYMVQTTWAWSSLCIISWGLSGKFGFVYYSAPEW